MSVPSRKLYDAYNQTVNPDGTLSYSCCNGEDPVSLYVMLSPFPSMLPQMRASLVAQGVNPDEPWCRHCATVLEDLRDGVTEGGPLFVSLVAAIASFIPGLGTAVAVVLRAGLALAEGETIGDAFVEGVKAALPGGLLAEMAFNAGQAALRGESLEDIGVDALPLSDRVKDCIKVGIQIAKQIADGENVGQIILDQAYKALPDYAQRAVDLSVDLADGRSVAEIIVEQSQRELPAYMQVGLNAGMAVGFAQSLQEGTAAAGVSKTVGRIDTLVANDEWARKGQLIAYSNNIAWHERNMLSVGQQAQTNDQWRRGYDIGTAVSHGFSLPGPGQDAVRATMKGVSEFNGFDSARKRQYQLTLEQQKSMSLVLRVIPNTQEEETRNAGLQQQGLLIALNNPQVAAARALNADPAYKYGFDIGTAAAVGQTGNGAGKDAIRLTLGSRTPGPGAPSPFVANHGGGPVMQQGFDTALQLQFGLTKGGIVVSTHPAVAAGQLITSGMIGTGTTPDQKAAAMTSVVGSAAATAGAKTTIATQKGFFAKIWEFFGF